MARSKHAKMDKVPAWTMLHLTPSTLALAGSRYQFWAFVVGFREHLLHLLPLHRANIYREAVRVCMQWHSPAIILSEWACPLLYLSRTMDHATPKNLPKGGAD